MKKAKEIILLSVSGVDKPGVTSALTSILSNYNVTVLDIGQSVIHDILSLGIVFEVPEESEASPMLKDLLFRSYKLGVEIKFTPISENNYTDWVNTQGKERFIITILGRKLSAEQISKVTDIIYRQKLNIDIISRLSGRVPLRKTSSSSRACIELSVNGNPVDLHEMRREFLQVSNEGGVDIAFQEDNVFRRNRRLVVFDMDSSLIQTDIISELASQTQLTNDLERIKSLIQSGKITSKEGTRQISLMLSGTSLEVLEKIADKMILTEGAGRLFYSLKRYGYKTAIISTGFSFFAEYLKQKLSIDYVYANELEIEGSMLTGNLTNVIIDAKQKVRILNELIEKEGIHIQQVIAVGSGAGDLPLLNAAGLGIAYNAKPILKAHVDQSLSSIGLDGILYLIGYRDRELDKPVFE